MLAGGGCRLAVEHVLHLPVVPTAHTLVEDHLIFGSRLAQPRKDAYDLGMIPKPRILKNPFEFRSAVLLDDALRICSGLLFMVAADFRIFPPRFYPVTQ